MANYKLWNKLPLEQQVEKAQSVPESVIELGDEDILVGADHIADIIAILEQNPMLQPQQSVAIEEKKEVVVKNIKTKNKEKNKNVSRFTKVKK